MEDFKIGDKVRIIGNIKVEKDSDLHEDLMRVGYIVDIVTDEPYPIRVRWLNSIESAYFCAKELIHWKKGQLKAVKALYAKT